MKLFEIKNFNLTVREEAWGLLPFKKLLTRDKTKEKVNCMKEMLFIYHYTDIKSDYVYLLDDKERENVIKKDIGLSDSWSIDKHVEEAIELYKSRSITINEQLYLAALQSARDVASYLSNTHKLLYERDNNGKPTTGVNIITTALKQIPIIMTNLKASYKEVLKEQQETEGRTKGARAFNMFEDGFKIE